MILTRILSRNIQSKTRGVEVIGAYVNTVESEHQWLDHDKIESSMAINDSPPIRVTTMSSATAKTRKIKQI
jgi:alkyl hydroperoxide reductase subunit AhpC